MAFNSKAPSFAPTLNAPNPFGAKRNIMRKMIKQIRPKKLSTGMPKPLNMSKGTASGIAGNPAKLSGALSGGLKKLGGVTGFTGNSSSKEFGDGGGHNLGTTGVF